MITLDFLKKIINTQPAIEDFIPKVSQHVTPRIVNYKDKKMSFVIRLEGTPFEGINDQVIVSQFVQLNKVLSVLGKDLGSRLSVTCALQRKKIKFDRVYDFKNTFTRVFADKYMQRFNQSDYFENLFYFTVTLKYDDFKDAIEECNDLIERLLLGLRTYDPKCLETYTNANGIIFSEVYEFFGELINADSEQIPLSRKDAYTTLGAANLHFGTELLEIRNNSGTKYATMYDLKDFGTTKMKILNAILSLNFEFTFVQSFTYISQASMMKKIDDQLNRLQSVGDRAQQQQDELDDAKGHIQAGDIMFGDYAAGLIVYGNTPKKATFNGQQAYASFLNAGGYRFMRATLSAPSTYFSQLPNSTNLPRPFPLATTNLAASFSMYNYSHGKRRGNPLGDGSAVMPLQTQSNTLYDFNFHFSNEKEDNRGDKIAGHTLILGATGTGKTTLQTALLSFAERFDPAIFAVDLDRGMEIFIRALGGTYFSLRAGKPTGFNPFQLPDTPSNREFLYELVGVCARGRAEANTAEDEKQIKFAVDSVFSLDFEYRRFSAILQSVPIEAEKENSLRTRLEVWCVGGRYADWLDCPSNLFNPDDFYRIGFDCSDILKDDYLPTEPVLAYLFHLKNIMAEQVAAKNNILASIIEEFWHPARFPATQELMLKGLKTGRKLGEWMILVSQSPEDAIGVKIFSAIIQQTPTKIFLPNPDAEYEGSYSKCGLSQKEYEELINLSIDSRTFLVKQSKQSAFAKLDLYGFSDEVAILSGNSANVLLMEKAINFAGENPDKWIPVFHHLRKTGQIPEPHHAGQEVAV